MAVLTGPNSNIPLPPSSLHLLTHTHRQILIVGGGLSRTTDLRTVFYLPQGGGGEDGGILLAYLKGLGPKIYMDFLTRIDTVDLGLNKGCGSFLMF
jgi:hypothetical protein